MTNTIFWLIEYTGWHLPLWWDGDGNFTKDAHKAKRFNSGDDAKKEMDSKCPLEECIATEYIFTD